MSSCGVEESRYKLDINQFIDYIYKKNPALYSKLKVKRVRELKKSIKDGTYTLSPLIVTPFFKKGYTPPPVFSHIMHVENEPNIYLRTDVALLEDKLVLTALGFMLHMHFYRLNLFTDKSLGLRVDINEYYDSVCARGKVLQLYRCDLTQSLKTINKESLLLKLSDIVKDRSIVDFIGQFLSIPIHDLNGVDFTEEIGCRIPSAGIITEILLNFALIEFDIEFRRIFPRLDYTRYTHEVFISCPEACSGKVGITSDCEDVPFFDVQQVVQLFEHLNLAGTIFSIGPGDEAVPCYGGLVCVSQDGNIQVEYQ